MEENNDFDDQMHIGFNEKIYFKSDLPSNPDLSKFKYSFMIFLVKVYLIENGKNFLIKEGDLVNKESSFSEDYLKDYDRFTELTYGDIYVRQCAKDLEELREKTKKIQRVICENNQEVLISSETKRWNSTDYCVRFIKRYEKGEVEETLMPGKINFGEFKRSFNSLKRKLAENCPLKATDVKFLPVLAGFNFPLESAADKSSGIDFNSLESISSVSSNLTSNSSEISISSQQSSEENYGAHQANGKKISKIPRRSSSVLSNNSLKNFSSGSTSKSTSSTGIPVLKGSSLFKREALQDNNTQNLYKINKAESWILISPELLDLVKDKKIIENIDSRKADALTYRNTDKVRLMNLNEKEISTLEEKLPELCKELKLKNNERINIFRN